MLDGMSADPDCIFCKIVAGDIPAEVVHESPTTVAFRDLTPQAPTHVLVVPKRHVSGFAELAASDGELLASVAALANEVAVQEGLMPDGFRVVVNQGPNAGQSVFHMHWHVLGGRLLGWPPG